MSEPAKRKKDEESPAPEASHEVAKGGKSGLLLWAGAFLLMTTVIVATAVMVAQKRRNQQVQMLAQQVAADSLAGAKSHGEAKDSTLAHAAVPDSLAPPTAEDSLRGHVKELQVQVRQREDSLQKSVDTARKLQTRMERLQAELDTLRNKDVLLSDAEVTRLSRVFGSMQPRKAAPVLARMDNASVAAILLSIEERTAAKILASMPAERAAGISTLIRERAASRARSKVKS